MFLQRWEAKYAGKNICLNRGSNSQPPDHESDMLTTEPPVLGSSWDKFVAFNFEDILNASEIFLILGLCII